MCIRTRGGCSGVWGLRIHLRRFITFLLPPAASTVIAELYNTGR